MGVMYYRDAAGNYHPVNKGPKGDKGDKGDPGLTGPLDILTDVTAPPSTPSGKFLGTVSTGSWGAVDPPASISQDAADARYVNVSGDTVDGVLILNDRLYVNAKTTITGDLESEWLLSNYGGDFGGFRITSVGVPIATDDAANKIYVDGRIWKGTQAAYNAIAVKDPNVLYVITG